MLVQEQSRKRDSRKFSDILFRFLMLRRIILAQTPNSREGDRGTVPLVAALVSLNEIRCRWDMDVGVTYVPRYRRYMGQIGRAHV